MARTLDPTQNGHGSAPSSINSAGMVTVSAATTSDISQPSTGHKLTWREAVRQRKELLKVQGNESLARYAKQRKSRIRWITALAVVVALAFAGSFWYNYTRPSHDAAQDVTIAQLKRQVAELLAPKFPMAAAVGAAHPRVAECFSYSDQLQQDIVAILKQDCGWNGSGVANLVEIFYDPDPNLVTNVTAGGFSAVPFRVRLAGTDTVLYYVPVQQTGPATVKVLGPGSFFFQPPGFIAQGNAVDNMLTGQTNNVFQQTVTQFLSGAARLTVPGVKIPTSSNALKPVDNANVTVYQGTPTHHVVSAVVTFAGPTLDAKFTMRYAFDMYLSADGDWRVGAVGPDVNQNLTGG